MRSLVIGVGLAVLLVVAFGTPTVADWVPEDGHKMHYPQLPNVIGWDVNATQPLILAEDWMCTETGWVKDVHFWGSWMHGIEGQVLQFVLSIHEDIPAEQSPTGFSMPGATLWEREISNFIIADPIDPPGPEGWYDPMQGQFFPDDHLAYFQYNVFLPEEDWFWQEEGRIYWLNISAIVEDPAATQWGWKSTLDRWNDDAVWAMWGDLNWMEMFEPPDFLESLNLAFVITGGRDTCDFYKLPYPDYSPQGMPDFDQKQAGWTDQNTQWSHDGPVALANCLWWFDSKFEPSPVDPRPFGVTPPNDNYPLLAPYGAWDDHDPANLPPFVNDLAVNYLNTNPGGIGGTMPQNLQNGLRAYLLAKGLDRHYTDTVMPAPSFEYIQGEVLTSQDVILLLGFYEDRGAYAEYIGGHYVTTAGVCAQTDLRQICISDPYLDALEGEPPAGAAHGGTVHNDADNISGPHGQINHDPYLLTSMIPPGFVGPVEVVNYPTTPALLSNFTGMNAWRDWGPHTGGTVYTVIDLAFVICPTTLDTVVCEPQGFQNPNHPPTYWYDVTPGGGTGRCDFHVKVFDSIAANYSNWVQPAGWTHAVHKVGSDWWVSWWDPTCTAAIFNTFRFQFDNPNPLVWSDWVTSNSGTNNPAVGAVDSTANHPGDPDGFGYYVHVPFLEAQEPEPCDYYKPPYEDYVPNGMPDFDQKQYGWTDQVQRWSYCGPVALANCFWWFDSKFEPFPLDPRPFQPSAISPPANDNYPLVQSYDPTGLWDDHDTNNVMFLVDSLARYCQTEVFQPGTRFHDLVAGASNWLNARGLLADYDINVMPGDGLVYEWIRDEVMRSEDLILLLGFWEELPTGLCHRVGGHYVTIAGVCDVDQAICISDPYFDMHEGEPPAGSAHAAGVHNDAFNISGPHGTILHDKYFLSPPPPLCPGAPPYWTVNSYPIDPVSVMQFEGQNDGDIPSEPYQGGTLYTVIEYVLDISPCCVLRGDADHSGAINVSDLTYMVAYLFQGGPPPICFPEGDVDGSGAINVSDLTFLVAYLFQGGPPPGPC